MKIYPLTSGDPNGIGLEVLCKALEILGPKRGAQFLIYRGPRGDLKQLQRLKKKFTVQTVTDLSALKNIPKKSSLLIDYVNMAPAPFWVEDAAKRCLKNEFSGLITAPLSKKLIQSSGFSYAKGHTEILQKVAKAQSVNMVFIGAHFNVLLATAHLPYAQVPRVLRTGALSRALDQAHALRKILPSHQKRKPVALLGLNPHAGEGGVLGCEELLFFSPLLKRHKRTVVGPLAPDVAFKRENWDHYSVYVCSYHDQGLIPFKLVHGQKSGYHLTFGLPFIRTSVDHGTAFDIFGKNKADPSSMLEAIRACLNMTM